jgi:hypothetical protein
VKIKFKGAFSRMVLEADQFIGNYKGKIRKNLPQSSNQEFVWPVCLFLIYLFLNLKNKLHHLKLIKYRY